MSKIYEYARISRKEHSIKRQTRNIEAAYPEAHGSVLKFVYSSRLM